jgi:hypothetical protein
VRLRRAKLEVVVPAALGAKYRPARPTETNDPEVEDTDDTEATDGDEGEDADSGKKSKVEFVEDIVPEAGSPGRFFLRVGLGRKASGSYYTPDSFVRFLVQETLRPQVEQRSPVNDPQPGEILKLKVLDPAMGSGHFLVGACRFLGETLLDACRECAKLDLWERVPAEVVPYLPGKVQEGESESGISAQRALVLCKRLVAVHCLYGVDKRREAEAQGRDRRRAAPLPRAGAYLVRWRDAGARGVRYPGVLAVAAAHFREGRTTGNAGAAGAGDAAARGRHRGPTGHSGGAVSDADALARWRNKRSSPGL